MALTSVPHRVLLLALVVVALDLAAASQFRGAIGHWRAVDPVNFDGRVLVSHRISWQEGRAFFDASNCTASPVIMTGRKTEYTCRAGCSGSPGSVQFQYTAFSVGNGWSIGQGTNEIRLSKVTKFEVSYTGCGWISLHEGGGSWEVRVKGDLSTREDIGRINASPTTDVPPIIKLQYGVPRTIPIPVHDADGDIVQCRWAESRNRECGCVCNGFTTAGLNQDNCSLSYNGTGNTGVYAVALQVEDYASASSTEAISSVPAQFLVEVVRATTPPSVRPPTFVGDTPSNGDCCSITTEKLYELRITAMGGEENAIIANISTVSPVGMVASDLMPGNSSSESYINVTWTPSPSQQGANILCYIATDNSGLSSEQVCITLVVGVGSPQLKAVVLMSFDNGTFGLFMQYDQQIARPGTNASHLIRVFQKDGTTEVLSVDVSNSSDATYAGMALTITTSVHFNMSTEYYLKADQGVAITTAYCPLESAAITNSSEWEMKVCDIAVRVSAPGDMPNEMTGKIELSVETVFSIPAPPELSTAITLKSGTAKFGEDFTTLSGMDNIMLDFDVGNTVASEKVIILIHDDSIDEFTECFTAESQITNYANCETSTTICIKDVRKVLYAFKKAEYEVYESTSQVPLTLSSSRSIPLKLKVDVDTVTDEKSNATAGFDFKEGHFTATFTENSKDATVEIPIVADFDSQEGEELFSVQLSLQSREILSDLPYITHVRLGSISQAKVRILEENILNFIQDSIEVREGENLTLTVTASTASVRNFTFNVNITGSDDDEFKGSQCMEDLDCGPHLISLPTGSTTASLNLSIIDDEVEECEEKFVAEIILGEGNSRAGFRRGLPYKIPITVTDNEEVQEQFCFGEEITDRVRSFEILPVNITRAIPACGQASVDVTVTFEENGTPFHFTEECKFQHLDLDTICKLNVNGSNKDLQNDTVQGVVTLEQNSTAFCNITEKNTTIYKFPTYCWFKVDEAAQASVGEGNMSTTFLVFINRSGSTFPSYISEQCAFLDIEQSSRDVYIPENAPDCCFSEANITEISCNVTVTGLNTTVMNQTVPLQLKPTDHNLVCNQDILSVEVERTAPAEPSVTLTDPTTSPLIGVSVALAVLITAAVGACVPVIVCVYFRSRRSRKKILEGIPPSVEYHYIGQANTEVVRLLDATAEEWEIPRSEIEVGDKLGQGNYGAVFKGQLTVTAMSPRICAHKKEMDFEGRSHLIVAVKMLRHNSSVEEKEMFMDEINVMKRVSDGNNPHVLKMLGCVTTTNPMMLVLQFVPHGNLKDYIRALKTAHDATVSEFHVADPSATGDDATFTGGDPTDTGGDPTDTGGDPAATGGDPADTGGDTAAFGGDPVATDMMQGSHPCSSLPAGRRDSAPHFINFASFGYQIASGMEFLMTKGVIHRDLACRNILVGDNELLKICDFGLAKETLEYTSALKTRLPIRWMAPEAFLRGEFSEKSDVWAYGVCLWEIFSFGDLPYSELGNTVILSRVMAGYRLDCPEGCPDKVYSIMKECWNDDKDARPTFLKLQEEFDGLISQEERYNYLPLTLELTAEGPTPSVEVEPATSAQSTKKQVETAATEDTAV